MKKHAPAALLLSLAFLGFKTASIGGTPLPDGWWLQESPEQVFARAQSINEQLLFFHGEKRGSTLSPLTNPFAKGNETNRTEFFKRRNTDGLIETKNFELHGSYQGTQFQLRSGNYYVVGGQVIKQEFADGDEKEKLIAAKVSHPYTFALGSSEMVLTNDCFVIVRRMTGPLLKAAADVYYEKYSDEKKNELAPKYIRSQVDFYFRKSDGVSFGVMKRNRTGEVLDDHVYDKVEVDQPIANAEFILPNGDIKSAKSLDESLKISMAAMDKHRKKNPKKPGNNEAEKQISKLPWATNVTKAIQQAKAEKKTVLLDFTGSDWCVWCMKFDEDVLSKPEFAEYAKANLVMVMLDFPNNEKQSDEVKKANKSLRRKYKDPGFPTFILLNSAGEEIGRQTGYLDGGTKAFIEKLEEFKKR